MLNRILAATSALLAAVLITVTAVRFRTSADKIGLDYRKADPPPAKVVARSTRQKSGAVDSFTELGRLRALTKPNPDTGDATVVIVSPWFSYPAGDTVLFEEMSQKDRQLKSLVLEYFSSMTEDELRLHGENKIKDDLKAAVNSNLVLGKITAVYFDEYIFIGSL